MTLYLDLGNTNLKVGYIENNKWIFNTFNNKDNFEKEFKQLLKKQSFSRVWISSTNSKIEVRVLDCLGNLMVRKIDKDIKSKLGFDPAGETGDDIIVNTFYVGKKYKNVILFSLGTAFVVSHIKEQILQGVSIFPGIQSSLHALNNDTEKVGLIKLKDTKLILGNTTQTAVSAGIINSYKYIIEGFVKEIDSSAEVIITGGGCRLLKKNLSFKIEENITLFGLYEIEKNFG